MKPKAPAVRRNFMNAGDEVNYLHDKVLYWLHVRGMPKKAFPFAKRMQKLLLRSDATQESILGQENRSLAFETFGNLAKAIKHRQQEIGLIRWLQEISDPTADFIVRFYGPSTLSARLELLAKLFRDNGELENAIATLRESRMICEEHGITFNGTDLLRRYLKERKNVGTTK